jgi:hypothetical protein
MERSGDTVGYFIKQALLLVGYVSALHNIISSPGPMTTKAPSVIHVPTEIWKWESVGAEV